MQTAPIKPKEQLFCLHYTTTRDARLAAARAGYRLRPVRTAERLLTRSDIRAEIARLAKPRTVSTQEVCEGYRRLAFGSITDVLHLVGAGEPLTPQELECLDLFHVAELKWQTKETKYEVKFFDRLKALDKLLACTADTQAQETPAFYRALYAAAGQSKAQKKEEKH